MILNGCSAVSGSFYSIHTAWPAKSYVAPSRARFLSSGIRNSLRMSREENLWSSRGYPSLKLSTSSTLLLRSIPLLQTRHNPLPSPKAAKDVPISFRYSAITKKPEWWWRTLASLPYLIPLHQTCQCAETAYHLHLFLETFELLAYPFQLAVEKLPIWFQMAYLLVAYPMIVRRKEWPHFLRFHVVMGMLMGMVMQIIGTVTPWMPLSVYWGKLGMHFWAAMTFAYLFTMLECIRCALDGTYADVPFVCDAAYMHIPYD